MDVVITGIGVVKDPAEVPKRILRKTDRFAQLALAAADRAARQAELTDDDRADTGVWLGTAWGGGGLLAQAVESLAVGGPGAMTPWLATGWFPASAQGWISILHGFKAQSRTFGGGRVSGALACHFGGLAVRAGRNATALAGGADAAEHGDGAAILVLETGEACARRGVPALARVSSSGVASGAPGSPEQVGGALSRSLAAAGLRAGDIAFVVAGEPEARAARDELGAVPVMPARDDRSGAGFPADVAGAVKALGDDAAAHAIVVTTGDDGTAAALVVSRSG
ncbi:beta-ketoacyl synthase N-terminal-like domain-containing protein [Amycolatopsis pigmentata]|uniref:Beta-ketoacyl synthase N-terminal-like domain-containing protein n=1 Tax=Amycolatopsis pigmentata TaxID=450801 RepID=A0ABW5FQI5_9PSEU